MIQVVLPAKLHSSRVPNKNWRPFFQGKSLVEVKLEQLLKHFPAAHICLSSDAAEKKAVADHYGVSFQLRDAHLASDDTPWADVVTGIVDALPCSDDTPVLWAEATTPLFDAYDDLVRAWEENKHVCDSVATVLERREFLMDSKGRAVNFGMGKWHVPSQELEPLYAMDASFIIPKGRMKEVHYMIGTRPHLYVLESSVEIDSMDEFELASALFAKRQEA